MRNLVKHYKNGSSQSTVEHIRAVKNNLGIRCAAGMCRNKGVSVEMAIFILLGK